MTAPWDPYAVLLAAASGAFALAWLVQTKPVEITALSWRRQLVLPAALAVGFVSGARLPVVLASADWIADGPTLTTALAVGYLAMEAVRVAAMMPPASRDSVALPLALALGVARMGCFVNGCCRGAATSLPWAVDFGDGIARHPTQLYESCFHLVASGATLWLPRRWAPPGQVLRLYLAAYCAYRFATEWIRLERPWRLGITRSQAVVLLLGTVLVALWWRDAPEARRARRARIRARDSGSGAERSLDALPGGTG